MEKESNYQGPTLQMAVDFITQYRKFEKLPLKSVKAIIESVVPNAHDAKHLYDSWKGRKKNFGSFFLNLDYTTQGKFIEHFGIHIDQFEEFILSEEKDPCTTHPPATLYWLYELVHYFYNNGIGNKADLKLWEVPEDKDKRFGNSSNWADYILSLNSDYQWLVMNQLFNYIMKNRLPGI